MALMVLLAFLMTSGLGPIPSVYGQELSRLPQPGTPVNLSTAFLPPMLVGMKVFPREPFRFDFILDKGDAAAAAGDIGDVSNRLIKYFLAALTVPEKDMWVNLSPYEKDRLVPEGFGRTGMGRDLLAEDYILKQITASVLSPEGAAGRKFWDKVYALARERYGTIDIPVDTFNKVWIVPAKAKVYENAKAGTAYVVDSRLKVMLEADYLAMAKSSGTAEVAGDDIARQVLREIIIPILEKEVNEGQNFAQLRQVYHSLILAAWFKRKIKAGLIAQAYVDRQKTAGIDIADKDATEKIWQRYVTAFNTGVYNFIKEEKDPVSGEVLPRKYFSGGMNMDMAGLTTTADSAAVVFDAAMPARCLIESVQFDPFSDKVLPAPDHAMFKTVEEDPRARAIRKKTAATSGPDGTIDLEHDTEAMRRLTANKDMEALRQIAAQGISASRADEILDGNYTDPQFLKEIFDQNPDPKGQGFSEAIANAIDALGGAIGQFGWGIKQMLAWLPNDGTSSLSFVTHDGGGQAYEKRLFRGEDGQVYTTGVRAISLEDFEAKAGGITQGTRMLLELAQPLSKGSWDEDADRLTQIGLAKRAMARFTFSRKADILIRVGGEEERWVNGWESRKVITGQAHAKKARNEDIVVDITPHRIMITDRGTGMGLATIARMFIPGTGGTKQVPRLQAQEIPAELERTAVIHDTRDTAIHRVSFVRNEEVIESRADILRRDAPATSINPDAVVAGELALEFGRLAEIHMARDKVIFPSEHNPREIVPIVEGVVHMARGIMASQEALADKVKYVNTIVTALDALVGSNEFIRDIVKSIKKRIAEMFTEQKVVEQLRADGYVLLPDAAPYGRLDVGAKVVYLNPALFDWDAVRSLAALGAVRVDPQAIRFVREDRGVKRVIPLMALPFHAEALAPFDHFNLKQYNWQNMPPMPVIATDDFIALPSAWMARFLDLCGKRIRNELNENELTEFGVWAQAVKILSDPLKVTSYELAQVKETVVLPDSQNRPAQDEGHMDSGIVNAFLVTPPQETTRSLAAKAESPEGLTQGEPNLHYMIADNGSTIRDMRTEAVLHSFRGEGKYIDIRPLGADHYMVKISVHGTSPLDFWCLETAGKSGQRYEFTEFIETKNGVIVFYDDDKKGVFSFDPEKGGPLQIIDMRGETGAVSLQLSWDQQFLIAQGAAPIAEVYDLKNMKYVTSSWMLNVRTTAMVPTAVNAPLVQGVGGVMDVKNNILIENYLASDPQGRFSVGKNDQGLLVYSHADGKILSEINGKKIQSVSFAGSMAPNVLFSAGIEGRSVFVGEDFKSTIASGSGISFPALIVRSSGDVSFRLDNDKIITARDPAPGTFYKHPDFDFFIDALDPDNQKAIRISDGEEIPFKGRILKFIEAGKGMVLFSEFEGKVISSFKKVGIKSVKDLPAVMAGPGEPKYALEFSPGGGVLLYYFAGNNTKFKKTESVDLQGFSQAVFDGKYFVLTNPDTGAFAFLDPENHTHPVVGWLQAPVPADGFGSLKKGEPNLRYMVSRNGHAVTSMKTGKEHLTTYTAGFRHIGGDYYMTMKSFGRLGPDEWTLGTITDEEMYGTMYSFTEFQETKDGKIIFYDRDKEGVYVLDPKKGEVVRLLDTQPLAAPVSLQMSWDENFLIILSKNASFVMPLENTQLMLLQGVEVLHAMPAVNAPLIQVKGGVFDVKNRKLIPGYIASDETGQLSVGRDGGGLMIYSHKTGDKLSMIEGHIIQGVSLIERKYKNDVKTLLIARTEKGAYGVDADLNIGRMPPVPLPLENIKVQGTGTELTFWAGADHISAMDPTPGTFYKHPDLDLIIDARDPDNKMAIHVSNGEKMPFKGNILAFFTNDDRTCMLSELDGKAAYSFKFNGNEEVFTRPVIVDDPRSPQYFLELLDFGGVDLSRVDKDGQRIEPFAHLGRDIFSQAVFDGKYFVLTNPDTGAFAFLDPERPSHLQTGWPQPQVPSVTDTKPDDTLAPYDEMILEGSGNRVWSPQIGQFRDGLGVTRRIRDNVFIQHHDEGDYDEEEYDTVIWTKENNPEWGQRWRYVTHAGGLVVFKDRITDEEAVYDVDGRIWVGGGFNVSTEARVSSSGRFFLIKVPPSAGWLNGGLMWSDRQATGKKVHFINAYHSWRSWEFNPKAEVVVGTLANGRKQVFDLKTGAFVRVQVGDKFNDVYFSPDGSYGFFVLPNGKMASYQTSDGKVYDATFDEVYYSEDAGHRYYGQKDGDKLEVWRFGKKGGLKKYFDGTWSPPDYPMYWHRYDKHDDTLLRLDRSSGQLVKKVQEHSLDVTDEVFLQDGILVFDRSGRNLLGRHDGNDLVLGDWDFQRGERLGSLNGKVGFLEDGQSGVLAMMRGTALESLANRLVFVNASHSHILIQRDDYTLELVTEDHVYKISHAELGLSTFDLMAVNGAVFVFHSENTGKVRYFNPDVYLKNRKDPLAVTEGALFPEAMDKLARAKALWQDVTGQRTPWIVQARAAYAEFMDLVPEEVRSEVTASLKGLYNGQEKASLERFRRALADPDKGGVDIRDMPFDRFARRMARVLKMKPALEALMAQARHGDSVPRYLAYQSLFAGLLAVCADMSIDLESNGYLDEGDFYETLALGWRVRDQKTLEAGRDVARLVRVLRGMYGDMFNEETVQNMVRFLAAASATPEALKTVMRQAMLLVDFPNPVVREKYLGLWYASFSGTDVGEKAIHALGDPRAVQELGQARDFVVFLTSNAALIEEGVVPEYHGQPLFDGIQGVGLEFIQEWSRASGEELYSIEQLGEFLNKFVQAPPAKDQPETREVIAKQVRLQGQPRAYGREIAQNSIDAKAAALKVRIYRDRGRGVMAEEWTDDGTGAPLRKALALLIQRSNKERDGSTTGRYGIGKFTMYAGADEVEIITNNGQEAYYFKVNVDQKTGYLKVLKVLRLDAALQPKGVTIRRMNRLDDIFPELEKFMRERMAKVMAGLSQTDKFSILVADAEGAYKPMDIHRKQVVAETAVEVNGQSRTARLLSVMDADIPSQIIDEKGLKVEDIAVKEKFLALVPDNLRHHFKSLGLVIQLPLPCTQNRDSFEQEAENMPMIQTVVAVLFYRALAYKALFDKSFILGNGFPQDWEKGHDAYWDSVAVDRDPDTKALTDAINRSDLGNGLHERLQQVAFRIDGRSGGMAGIVEKLDFTKFLVRLEVFEGWDTTKAPLSILGRRIKVQAELMDARERERLGRKLGVNVDAIMSAFESSGAVWPTHYVKTKWERRTVPRSEWNKEDKKLMILVAHIGRSLGFNRFELMETEGIVSGAYIKEILSFGNGVIAVNRNVAGQMSSLMKNEYLYEPADVVLHELAHYAEDTLNGVLVDKGFTSSSLAHTHDAQGGRFSLAFEMVSAVWLAYLSKQEKSLAEMLEDESILDQLAPKDDHGQAQAPGGIDLHPVEAMLEVEGASEASFPVDPAMLQRYDAAPGLVPVILGVRPAVDLSGFLGITPSENP